MCVLVNAEMAMDPGHTDNEELTVIPVKLPVLDAVSASL